MFLKIYKLKLLEVIKMTPIIITFIISLLITWGSLIATYFISNNNFYQLSYAFILITFVVDFILIFIMSFYCVLEDYFNYYDINLVSKSFDKKIIVLSKMIVLLTIGFIKSILDMIFTIVIIIILSNNINILISYFLLTFVGQMVFFITIIPIFILVSLSKKVMTFLITCLGIMLFVFGLSIVGRATTAITSKNNNIDFNSSNLINYSLMYDTNNNTSRIVISENVEINPTTNLNADPKNSISNVSIINGFIPTNIFFSLSEWMFSDTAKYYEDESIALKYSKNNYNYALSRFEFKDYKLMRSYEDEKYNLFFINPRHKNLFKYNSIELEDFIIQSMKNISNIDWANENDVALSRIYTIIATSDKTSNWKDFNSTDLEIIKSILGLNDVCPEMLYILLYNDELLSRVPNILYSIQENFSNKAAKVFCSLFFDSYSTFSYNLPQHGIQDFGLSNENFYPKRSETLSNIKINSQLNASEYISNNIPNPFEYNENLPPSDTLINFFKSGFVTGFGDDGSAMFLLDEADINTGDSYVKFTKFNELTSNWNDTIIGNFPSTINQDLWNEFIDRFKNKPISYLRKFYDTIQQTIGSNTKLYWQKELSNNSIKWNTQSMWANYININEFSYSCLLKSNPYTDSYLVFSLLNLIFIPFLYYLSIYLYYKMELDINNN